MAYPHAAISVNAIPLGILSEAVEFRWTEVSAVAVIAHVVCKSSRFIPHVYF